MRDSALAAPFPSEALPPPPSTATAGGAYILQRLVGRGGFGEIWQSIQTSAGRRVAVKRLRDDLVENKTYDKDEAEHMVEDFQREAMTTALLEHPNIVPVHDIGMDADGRPLLAMKLVKGMRWDHLLQEDFEDNVPLSDHLARHLPILLDVAQAVAFAHSRGIVHRDLKPSQVMVGEFGETLLMDWGMAVLYEPELLDEGVNSEDLVPRLEEAFNPTGTPSYMAPEQTLPTAKHIGPWTDVYLLGASLYYILTRRGPHSSGDSKESFLYASQGYVVPFDEAAPGREIPSDLAAIALRAMAPDPRDRHESAKMFIAALEDYMTGAGRRRESAALTREVGASLPGNGADYGEMNDAITKLQRATALWPENGETKPLLNRVYRQFAHEALRNKDLMLARLMAESIDGKQQRTELLEEIHQAQRRVRWSARQRTILKVVSAILVAVIIFDLWLIFMWTRSDTGEAVRARQRAEQRAAVAESQLRELREQFEALIEEVEPDAP